jgi:hypothetical protein
MTVYIDIYFEIREKMNKAIKHALDDLQRADNLHWLAFRSDLSKSTDIRKVYCHIIKVFG